MVAWGESANPRERSENPLSPAGATYLLSRARRPVCRPSGAERSYLIRLSWGSQTHPRLPHAVLRTGSRRSQLDFHWSIVWKTASPTPSSCLNPPQGLSSISTWPLASTGTGARSPTCLNPPQGLSSISTGVSETSGGSKHDRLSQSPAGSQLDFHWGKAVLALAEAFEVVSIPRRVSARFPPIQLIVQEIVKLSQSPAGSQLDFHETNGYRFDTLDTHHVSIPRRVSARFPRAHPYEPEGLKVEDVSIPRRVSARFPP